MVRHETQAAVGHAVRSKPAVLAGFKPVTVPRNEVWYPFTHLSSTRSRAVKSHGLGGFD